MQYSNININNYVITNITIITINNIMIFLLSITDWVTEGLIQLLFT